MVDDIAFAAEEGLLLFAVCHCGASLALVADYLPDVVLSGLFQREENLVLQNILIWLSEDIVMPIQLLVLIGTQIKRVVGLRDC